MLQCPTNLCFPLSSTGHNLPFAVIGNFLLWLGWFGFNPGRTTIFDGNLPRIAVMTNIAGILFKTDLERNFSMTTGQALKVAELRSKPSIRFHLKIILLTHKPIIA